MAQETIFIDFVVDYDQLTSAQEQLAKSGKIDTKGFENIQDAIDNTAKDTKGLIKQFKDVAGASIKMGKSVEDAFGQGVQDALHEAGVSADEFADALALANKQSKPLRTQLRDLKEELARMKVAGKDNTKQFRELTEEAGNMAGAIANANSEIKNAGSDTRGLDNVVGSITALAGGYSAVQGAVALFGEENEDLQKALLKVNAAMALALGLQQVQNALQKEGALTKLADSVATGAQTAATTLYTFAVGGATVATRAFRVALLATGIGAVVVLVVALVQAFSDHNDKVKDAVTEIDNLNDAYGELTSTINQYNDEAASIASLQGASESAVLKIRLAGLKELISANRDLEDQKRQAVIDSQKNGKIDAKLAAEVTATFQEGLKLKSQERVLEAQITAAIKKETEDRIKAIKDANDKKRAENQKALDAARDAELKSLDEIVKFKLKAIDKEIEQERIGFENSQAIYARDKEAKLEIEARFEAARKALRESFERSAQIEIDKRKKDAADKKAIEDAELARKIKNANITIQLAQQTGAVIANIAAAQTAREQQKVQAQQEALNAQIKAGAISAKAAEQQQKKIDELSRRGRQKAAEREKKAAVFQAVLAIPQAYLSGLSTGGPAGIAIGAIMAALAAAQAVIIANAPVPKFFRGKKGNYEGPGIVGDMGSELVERNGRMFLYTKPTQTYLGAKDKVYTAAETRNIMHNTNISTTLTPAKQERFDYERLGAAIPKSSININIDKDFITESVANGMQKTRYMDRRYSSK